MRHKHKLAIALVILFTSLVPVVSYADYKSNTATVTDNAKYVAVYTPNQYNLNIFSNGGGR